MNEPKAMVASTWVWSLAWAGWVMVLVGLLVAMGAGWPGIAVMTIGMGLIVIAAFARLAELLVDILRQIHALREELAIARGEDPLKRCDRCGKKLMEGKAYCECELQGSGDQLAPLPQVRIHHNGPIAQYLAFHREKREHFEEAFRQRDFRAVMLFAAEVIFGELQDMNDNIRRSTTSREPGDKTGF